MRQLLRFAPFFCWFVILTWDGQQVHGNIPSNARSLVQAKLKPKHVPDDWDDDDEEEEEIDAQRIWETAYAILLQLALPLPRGILIGMRG